MLYGLFPFSILKYSIPTGSINLPLSKEASRKLPFSLAFVSKLTGGIEIISKTSVT